MITAHSLRSILQVSMVSMAIAGLSVLPLSAMIIVTPSHIVSGSIVGDLIAVDVPYQGTTFPILGPLGPDWTDNADDGWRMNAGSQLEANHGNSPWEPDGTPFAEAKTLRLNRAPGSSYTFNLADGGIDLPDGLTKINAIYATWLTRGVSGAIWSYTEGAASGSLNRTMTSAPAADLVLSWTDSGSVTRNANFERLFTGPIAVVGGNGFTLNVVRTGNTHQADAVILDVTIIPEPSTFGLIGLMGLAGILLRRRRS